MSNEIVICNDKPIMRNSSWGYWQGDIPMPLNNVESTDLYLTWHGSTLPVDLFRQILSFFKWSYDTYKSETQVRLYYHPSDKEWIAVAMPQFLHTNSLYVDENDKDERFLPMQEDLVRRGYGHMGSAHHHCGAGAFASATDVADEIKMEGFHYTIGSLQNDSADLHTRCVVRGIMYDGHREQFLPYNDSILSLKKLPPFPEEWKSMLSEAVVPSYKPLGKSVNYGSTWVRGKSNPYSYTPQPLWWEDFKEDVEIITPSKPKEESQYSWVSRKYGLNDDDSTKLNQIMDALQKAGVKWKEFHPDLYLALSDIVEDMQWEDYEQTTTNQQEYYL